MKVVIIVTLILFWGCGQETTYVPKPRAYYRIELPKGDPLQFDTESCPFTFEYPSYTRVIKEKTFFNRTPASLCWFDLSTDALNGRIHMSYYPITSRMRFDELMSDAFELSSKHNTKANYIEETVFKKKGGVNGVIFKMEGPVASPYQFFITDSTSHFLRGALYINAKARPDSLQPIYQFLEKDADHIIETFQWK